MSEALKIEIPEREFPEVMTVEEAAEFLRVGRSTLYDAIGRKEIPHQRIGSRIRLSKSALVRWLGECDVPRKGG